MPDAYSKWKSLFFFLNNDAMSVKAYCLENNRFSSSYQTHTQGRNKMVIRCIV